MNIEYFKKQIEEEDKNKKWYTKIFHFLWYRIILKAWEGWPYEIKWWYQDLTRGYSDQDTWDVEHFVIRKVHGPLMQFVEDYEEGGMSLPTEFASDPAAWLMILKKIEYAVDQKWKEDFEFDEYHDRWIKMTDEERTKHQKDIDEGLELFGRWLQNLWD